MPQYPIAGNPGALNAISLTIASGQSVTEMFATQGQAVVGIIMPASWTAAAIGFKACLTGNPVDLQTVYNSGGIPEQTLAAAALPISIPQGDTTFFPFLQLTSVVAGAVTGVAQGADRTIIVLLRPYLT